MTHALLFLAALLLHAPAPDHTAPGPDDSGAGSDPVPAVDLV